MSTSDRPQAPSRHPAPPSLGYSGVFLISTTGHLLLQLRDEKPSIAHPGGVCTFGGGWEPGETPLEAALRELEEETELALAAEALTELGRIESRLDRSLVITGQFYAAGNIEPASLNIHEGQLITLTYAEARAHPKIVPACARAMKWLQI